MDVWEEIVTLRVTAEGHCGVSTASNPTFAELTVEFGLAADMNLYREIYAHEAEEILASVLRCDLAYGSEEMSSEQAESLARQVMGMFASDEVRYYTNGYWRKSEWPTTHLEITSWNPVTPATLDAGVIFHGARRSGCVWVEDED